MYQCLKAMKLLENLSMDNMKEMAVLINQEMGEIEKIMAQMSQSETAVGASVEVDDTEAENKGKGPMEDVDGGGQRFE